MVRLKDLNFRIIKGIRVFQFHDGSIKGYEQRGKQANMNKFQFHDGSIKGNFNCFIIAFYFIFQFHDGSIKGVMPSSTKTVRQYFNSTMVRLKVTLWHTVELEK